jgi:SAM-dependent methyltransferase
MTQVRFTGERLHAGHALFGVDLARHRAAYHYALEHARGGPLLDLGSGSGYGAAELAARDGLVVALDRVAPDAAARAGAARFLRADLSGIPLAAGRFTWITSFQVIEHLADPGDYLRAIARLLAPGGTAFLTTPNRLTSDGANPFHVHEYEAAELAACLRRHFGSVELLGIGASPAVQRYFDARLARIRSILRIDPLGLRHHLPRPLVEALFALFARVVRRGIQRADGLPDASVADSPVGAADAACIDLLAVCREPRAAASA